jgi:uncharacterized protein with PQ loop repeat
MNNSKKRNKCGDIISNETDSNKTKPVKKFNFVGICSSFIVLFSLLLPFVGGG